MHLLAGTRDGIRLVGSDLPRMPAGCEITALAPAVDGIWAITDGAAIWFDPGVGEGEPVAYIDGVTANCILPTGGDTALIGTSEAGLLRLSEGTLEPVTGFGSTPGRDRWYTPWGGPPDVRSMALGTGGVLYVNVHVGGVLRSTDGGRTWAGTMDIDADVHQVAADCERPGHAYAAAAIGLGTTDDAGTHWEFETAGLHAIYCRAVTRSAATLFVSASRGPGGDAAAVYRRRGGGTLQRCRDGLPEWFSGNVDTGCLVASGRMVAVGDPAGTVYLSEDDGETWTVAEAGLPGITCLTLV